MIVLFDFDGVLVDIYSCLREFYKWLREELGIGYEWFVDVMLYYEELYDACRKPHRDWWRQVFNLVGVKDVDLEFLVRKYWSYVIDHALVYSGAYSVLEKLSSKHILGILCLRDEIPGQKIKRIERHGFRKFFKKIYIVGDNIGSRREALEDILRTYSISPKEVYIVDDKPEPLMEVKTLFPEVNTVKIVSRKGIPWGHPFKPDYTIDSLWRLLDIVGGV